MWQGSLGEYQGSRGELILIFILENFGIASSFNFSDPSPYISNMFLKVMEDYLSSFFRNFIGKNNRAFSDRAQQSTTCRRDAWNAGRDVQTASEAFDSVDHSLLLSKLVWISITYPSWFGLTYAHVFLCSLDNKNHLCHPEPRTFRIVEIITSHFSSDLSVSYSYFRFQSVIQCLSLRFESAMCMGKLMRKQVGEDKNAHPRIKIS